MKLGIVKGRVVLNRMAPSMGDAPALSPSMTTVELSGNTCTVRLAVASSVRSTLTAASAFFRTGSGNSMASSRS